MITPNTIPHIYADTYAGDIGNLYYLYNPLSSKGLTLLTAEMFFLYSLANGKSSIKKLQSLMSRRLPSISLKSLTEVYTYLYSRDLIYLVSPLLMKHNKEKKETLLVWLHITNQCNLNCSYCWVKKSSEKMNEPMIKKSIQKIVDSAVNKGFHEVRFNFGGGEPLLEMKNIEKTISFANQAGKTAGIKTSFSITTNATLLTEKACVSFRKQNVRVAISLDGLENYNDSNRQYVNGLGTFKQIIPGILRAKGNNILDGVLVTVTNKNVDHIPKIVSYLIENKIYKFRLQLFLDNPNAKKNLKPSIDKLIFNLKKAYDLAYKSIPGFSIDNSLLYQVNLKQPKYSCEAGKSFITLLPSGNITACSYDLDTVIASVEDKDILSAVGKNNNISPVLDTASQSECKNCRWKYVCTSCPVFYSDKKNDYCEVYKALIPHILSLEAKKIVRGLSSS